MKKPIFFLGTLLLAAINDGRLSSVYANASTYIANGNTAQVNGPTDTGGTYCRQVTNNSGQTIFVPANIPLEWSDFYTNPEPGVSIADCPPADCPAGSASRKIANDEPLQTVGFNAITNGNTVTIPFPSGSKYWGGGTTEYWGSAAANVTCNAGTSMITWFAQGSWASCGCGLAPAVTPGNPANNYNISGDGQQVISTSGPYSAVVIQLTQ